MICYKFPLIIHFSAKFSQLTVIIYLFSENLEEYLDYEVDEVRSFVTTDAFPLKDELRLNYLHQYPSKTYVRYVVFNCVGSNIMSPYWGESCLNNFEKVLRLHTCLWLIKNILGKNTQFQNTYNHSSDVFLHAQSGS